MGNHAIWANSPSFSLRRNRPIARRGRRRRWRNQTRSRVSRPSPVICSAKWATLRGNRKHARNSRTKCLPGNRRLSCAPGSGLHPGATKTNGGAIIERCCCLGCVTFVISPPASTSLAGERNAGAEIERSSTSTAAPLRSLAADAAHIKSEKSDLFRSCH